MGWWRAAVLIVAYVGGAASCWVTAVGEWSSPTPALSPRLAEVEREGRRVCAGEPCLDYALELRLPRALFKLRLRSCPVHHRHLLHLRFARPLAPDLLVPLAHCPPCHPTLSSSRPFSCCLVVEGSSLRQKREEKTAEKNETAKNGNGSKIEEAGEGKEKTKENEEKKGGDEAEGGDVKMVQMEEAGVGKEKANDNEETKGGETAMGGEETKGGETAMGVEEKKAEEGEVKRKYFLPDWGWTFLTWLTLFLVVNALVGVGTIVVLGLGRVGWRRRENNLGFVLRITDESRGVLECRAFEPHLILDWLDDQHFHEDDFKAIHESFVKTQSELNTCRANHNYNFFRWKVGDHEPREVNKGPLGTVDLTHFFSYDELQSMGLGGEVAVGESRLDHYVTFAVDKVDEDYVFPIDDKDEKKDGKAAESPRQKRVHKPRLAATPIIVQKKRSKDKKSEGHSRSGRSPKDKDTTGDHSKDRSRTKDKSKDKSSSPDQSKDRSKDQSRDQSTGAGGRVTLTTDNGDSRDTQDLDLRSAIENPTVTAEMTTGRETVEFTQDQKPDSSHRTKAKPKSKPKTKAKPRSANHRRVDKPKPKQVHKRR